MTIKGITLLSAFTLQLLILNSTALQAGDTTLINISAEGEVDNRGAGSGSGNAISEIGSVVFQSRGTNLVPNDLNGQEDIFLKDLRTGAVELISVNTSGDQSNGLDNNAEISNDGRWVLFNSLASNLGPPIDPNGLLPRGTYLRDRQSLTTVLIGESFLTGSSPQSTGGSDFTDDAGVIAFSASGLLAPGQMPSPFPQIYLFYRQTNTLLLVSQRNGVPGNGASADPRISADGTRVTYTSNATNLLGGALANEPLPGSVYLHDTSDNTTTLISIALNGSAPNGSSLQANIDDAGRYVSFASQATNLTDSDTNDVFDVFVRDTQLESTTLVSETTAGASGDGISSENRLTGDGNGVVFISDAKNLIPGFTAPIGFFRNVYFKDLVTQELELISVLVDGTPARLTSPGLAINENGRYVVFSSSENNLVSPSQFGTTKTYLRDRGASCDGNPDNLQFTLKKLEWELLSLPCIPAVNPTLGNLFADELGGEFLTDWTAFFFDVSINDYRQATLDDTIVYGQGFWIIQNIADELTLQLPESSRGPGTNFNARENCISDIGCVTLPLARTTDTGSPITWNMLGNPFNNDTTLSFDELRVVTPTGNCNTGCSVDAAFTDNTVLNIFYAYNSGMNAYLPITTGGQIDAWSGLWVGALGDVGSTDTRLVVPE